MATRSASIPPGAAVDITAALALETERGYLLAMGPNAKSTDYVIVALGGTRKRSAGTSWMPAVPAGSSGRGRTPGSRGTTTSRIALPN